MARFQPPSPKFNQPKFQRNWLEVGNESCWSAMQFVIGNFFVQVKHWNIFLEKSFFFIENILR
jgi:hypothetical protein